MTVTNRPAHHRCGPPARGLDGALLRVAVTALEGFPRAPAGTDVSVSFTSAAAATAGPALDGLGYRTVGVSAREAEAEALADFVVAHAVIEQHPRWWEAVAGRAEHAHHLALGPVQEAFAEVLRAHREPLR